ncbi:MAG: VCBS repeat-containing protein [Pirellulales bacterium]|nr:VCBS repeat-containing protein [Pirellulales bacterium]
MVDRRRRNRSGRIAWKSSHDTRLLKIELLEARRVLAGMFPGIGGTGLFVDTGPMSASSEFEDVVLGDLDGDGDIDAVAERTGNSVSSGGATIWRNDGAGQFQAIWNGNFAGGTQSSTLKMELGDLDGDGDLDLFSIGRSGSRVWTNDGSGIMSNTGQSLGSGQTSDLALGDFDNDGDLDAIVVSSSGSNAGLYINDGQAHFTLSTTTDFVALSNSLVEVADIDGDDDVDILVGTSEEGTLWRNNGLSGLEFAQTLDWSYVNGFTFGDLDNDGDVDGMLTTWRDSTTYWINDGSGQFAESEVELSIIGDQVLLADFDGDADLDALTASELLLNDSMGNFTVSPYTLPYTINRQAIADLDGDGDLDIFVAGLESGGIWLNADTDVEVTIKGIPGSVWIAPGDALTYQVTLQNHGPWQVDQLALNGLLSGPVGELTLTNIAVSEAVVHSLATGPVPDDWTDLLMLPGYATVVYQFTTSVLEAGDPELVIGDSVRYSVLATSSTDQTIGLPARHEDVDERIVLDDTPITGDLLVDTGQDLASGFTRDIAVGDLDNDGDLDAFVAQGSRNNQVWLNDGTGVFSDSGQRLSTEPYSQYGDGTNGQVALGDLDGDGDLDAVVSIRYRMRIWVNDGTGTFSESSVSFVVNGNEMDQGGQVVLLGDVNGDNHLDIVSLDNSRQSRVWFNNGGGRFNEYRDINHGNPTSAEMADIDGDGDLDIVSNSVVLVNDGTGTFSVLSQYPLDNVIALGDLDGDGDVDVLHSNLSELTYVHLNDGTGMFSEYAGALHSGTEDLRSMEVADFDSDGDLDCFQIYSNAANRLWLNDGSATFTDSGQYFTPIPSVKGTAADLDNDGDIDLLLSNSYGHDRMLVNASLPELVDISVTKTPANQSLIQGELIAYTITVENQTRSHVSGASFSESLTANLMEATLVSVATLGGAIAHAVPGAFAGSFSDTLDLPALSSVTYEVSARVTVAGTLSMPAQQTAVNTSRLLLPHGLYDPDLTNNVAARSFIIDFATRGGTASFSNVFSTSNELIRDVDAVALGDLNGDGFLDAVIAMFSDHNRVWLGNGDGTFQVDAQVLPPTDTTRDVALGDVDRDGDLDVVFANRDDPGRLWLNDGTGNLIDSGQPLEALGSSGIYGTEPAGVVLGDLDGDGDLDLLFTGSSESTTTWWNDGTGQFIDSGLRLTTGYSKAELGDADGDGDLDVLIPGWLLINDGQGIFERLWLGFGDYDGGHSFLRDLDGDGDLDISILNSHDIEVWLNDGGGGFTQTEQVFENFNIRDAGIADFDNDGDLDFIAAVEDIDEPMNRVWLNDGAAYFELLDIGFGDDATRLIAVGDLNNDGAVDYFELNSGWKQYHRVWLNAGTDLAIDIAEDPARSAVIEGSTVHYTVTVENLGLSPAEGAEARILFDPGITQIELVGMTTSVGATSGIALGSQERSIVDTINLPAGGSVVYEFGAVVGGPLQTDAAPKATVGLVARIVSPAGLLDGNALNDFDSERNILELASVGGMGFFEVSPQSFPITTSYSLALGDLDGDSDLDAYIGYYREHPNAVMINDGNGTFTALEQNFEIACTPDVALADFDGDGDLDAFEVRLVDHQLMLNDGSGHFTPKLGAFPEGQIEMDRVTLADIDGDGDIDVVPGGDRENILINDGTGQFNRGEEIGDYGNFCDVGDIDNDGDLDIVFGNRLYFNRGDGWFTIESLSTGQYTRVVLGDIDRDDDLDLIASYESTNHVLTNDGSGKFIDTGQSFGGHAAENAALADFDSDGDLDILFDGSELWLNDGTGLYINSGQSLRTTDTRDIGIGDLDGDGDVDAFFVGGAYSPGGVADEVWFNLSGDDFADLSVTNISDGTVVEQGDMTSYTVVVTNRGPADVMGASVLDFFSANLEEVTLVSVAATGGASGLIPIGSVAGNHFEATVNLPADSSLTFEFTARVAPAGRDNTAAETTVFTTAMVSLPAELRELTPSDNRDADSDTIELSATCGNASFGLLAQIPGNGSYFVDVALGDLDGDGDLDAFVGNDAKTPDTVWLNQGLGEMFDTGQRLGAEDTMAIALADLDGDGDLDAVTNAGTWRNDGSAGFEFWQGELFNRGRLAMGDLNGDSWIDVIANEYIWFNDGSGNLVQDSQKLSSELYELTTGDVDNDGDLDIVGRDSAQELLLNDGWGVFTHAYYFILDHDYFSGTPTLADLDHDGDLDAFFGGYRRPVWLNNGNGEFSPTEQEISVPGLVDTQFADIDNDGDLDALLAVDGNYPNRILLNDGAAHFTESSETVGDGYSVALATGDLDGDGDLDAIVANTLKQGLGIWLNLDSPAPFDLTVATSSDRTCVEPGESAIYTVVVRNDGPREVIGAHVEDTTFGPVAAAQVTSVVITGGATSAINPGSIDGGFFDVVDLPIGASITYYMELSVAPRLADDTAPEATIGNGVSVSDRMGANNDLNPADNRAVDGDLMEISANMGTGLFAEGDANLGTEDTRDVLLGDLNGDGVLDAVVINTANPSRVWLGSDGVLRDTGQSLDTGVNFGGILGDLDDDGDLDMFVYVSDHSSQDDTSVIWLNDGTGTFSPNGPEYQSLRWDPVTLGDLNGDGLLDAVSISGVWRNQGAANFVQLPYQMPDASDTGTIRLGDLDADGDLDALVTGNPMMVWFNDGTGRFIDSEQYGLDGGKCGSLGDIDRDGDLDALVGNIVMLNDGHGMFAQDIMLLPDGISSSIVEDSSFGDLDGDGDLDVLIADQNGSRVWINDGNGLFSNTLQVLPTPEVVAVSLGDLDGDGDLDMVTASFRQPTQVWRHLDAREVVDFSIRKTADPDVFRGETINYQIEIRNDGPGDSVALFTDTYDPRLSNIELVSVESINSAFTTLVPGPMGHQVDDLLFLPAGSVLKMEVSAASPLSGSENLAATTNYTSSASIETPSRIVDSKPTNNSAIALTLDQQSGPGAGILVDSGQRFGTGYVGKVALGDLDGDGDLDAFVVTRGPDQVLLNNGAGEFMHSDQVFADSNTTDVALGDFDGDGDLDAFLTTQHQGQQLWMNDGNAHFENANLNLGSVYGLEVIAIDIDGDGDLDAAVNPWSGDSWRVWLNNGSGDLSSDSYVLANRSRGAALGDLDGDGDADAFVAGSEEYRAVYFGNQPGQPLLGPVEYDDPDDNQAHASKPVALGDIDNDGDLDVLSATDGIDRWWMNDGSGTLTIGASYDRIDSNDVALGDLNGDGQLDVVVADRDGISRLYVDGAPTQLLETGQTWGVAIGDLDGDSDMDAFFVATDGVQVWFNANPTDLSIELDGATSAMVGEIATYLLTVRNDGTEAAYDALVKSNLADVIQDYQLTRVDTTGGAVVQATPGMDLTSVLDTIYLPAGATVTYTFTGKPGSSPLLAGASDASLTWSASVNPIAESLEHNFSNNIALLSQLFVTPATGGGGDNFIASNEELHSGVNTDVQLGDVDADGDLDILFTHRSHGTYVYLNNGSGVFGDPAHTIDDQDTFAAATGDADGDGDLDLLLGNRLQPLTWLRNNGTGQFTPLNPTEGDLRTRDILLGDLNGDGYLDAIEINQGDASRILLGGGYGTFADITMIELSGSSVRAALGDLDSDGDLDLFVANDALQPDQIWMNDGTGRFADSGQYLGNGDSTSVALGDIDGDGDLDAVVAGRDTPNVTWRNNGQGSFTSASQSTRSGDSGAAALADIDGDGDLDAVFGSSGATPSKVAFNEGGSFATFIELPGGYHSNAVAIGDLDGDGTLDIVFASHFQSSGRIWFNRNIAIRGDFNHDGSTDAADLQQWEGDFGINGHSDSDGDGDSDGTDFLCWQINFGQDYGQVAVIAAAPQFVPVQKAESSTRHSEFQTAFPMAQPSLPEGPLSKAHGKTRLHNSPPSVRFELDDLIDNLFSEIHDWIHQLSPVPRQPPR